jgi:hypothetical protein
MVSAVAAVLFVVANDKDEDEEENFEALLLGMALMGLPRRSRLSSTWARGTSGWRHCAPRPRDCLRRLWLTSRP